MFEVNTACLWREFLLDGFNIHLLIAGYNAVVCLFVCYSKFGMCFPLLPAHKLSVGLTSMECFSVLLWYSITATD